MEQEEPPDESTIWARAQEGVEAAFGTIFDLHKDRVFRHAFRLLGNRHDAEDALGMAFFELWRRRGEVRIVANSVLPWLLVTTSNVAFKSQRAQRGYQKLLDKLPRSESLPSAEEVVLAQVEQLSPELQNTIHALGAADRGLIALVIIEGYPIAEAAAALKISPGNARTRLSRLRVRLRTELAHVSAGKLAMEGNRS